MRGLESLIPQKRNNSTKSSDKESVFLIDVEHISPNPYQPRREFKSEELADLSESIKVYGILQPLLVTKIEEDVPSGRRVRYELIAGERRLRAARLAGLPRVPVIVRQVTPKQKLEASLIENLQRDDLGPLDEAHAFQRLQDEFGIKQKKIAQRISKSASYVANTLRILSLPDHIQTALASGDINEGHTRPLLALKNDKAQEKLFKEISLEAQSDIPTNLGNALVEALRNGRIYLTPNKDSGLYTRQMHEVSSLVTQSSPEFDKFKPNETYYKILEREFISNWVTTHHTHIGHMGHIDFNIVTAEDIKSSIIIKPQLSIEPFPTVYERMADNLVFLNNTLTSAFGEQFINKQRLDCNGRGVGTSIGEELCNLQSILRGLSYLSKDSIHMPYQCNTTAQESLNDAINWLKNISEDYDLEREAPIFTPIINGTYGSQYISYIIPGFTLAPISIFYSSPPNVSLKPYTRDYEFGSSSYLLPRLVHKEVRVSKDKLLNDRILKESLPRNLNLGQFEEFCNAL